MINHKRGFTLLLENIIFILLNLVFLAIIVSFLFSKTGSASVLEEKYAKEIALTLDSSRPGMMISLNMTDAVNAAQKNLGRNNLNGIVNIQGNVVTVKLSSGGGYSYSFFNNISITNYYLNTANNEYIFFVGGYNG